MRIYDDDDEYNDYRTRRNGDGFFIEFFGLVLKAGIYSIYYGGLILVYSFHYLLLYAPVMLAAYWGVLLLKAPLAQVMAYPFFLQVGAGIGIAYLTHATIYLLKGFAQRLRLAKKRIFWVLLAGCVIVVCIIPGILAQRMINDYFKQVHLIHIYSWIALPLVSGWVYANYKLHKDTCPAMVYWAYRLGVQTSNWALK